ncbi:hypothetical protein Aca07nite_59410 [Actinoplanes capillaceus]|uniref:CHAT domain-containing protein n=1 Tax=Actinoplanes campanulatus TaxID=113559 RepID=A0ABQ3WQU4_9ACTN|nr:tetratricopeptide repeat protein [Actinoplanes capillaceus]GID48666.1 hypothetical protein Aca07nite_59410 [Actinoplanes capillaceus]
MTQRIVVDLDGVARPLGDDVPGELRWYLEEYLSRPYAVYADRGERVGSALAGWGERLFETLLPHGLPGTRGDRRTCDLVLRSGDPRALGMPWELIHEPGRDVPLVCDGATLTRTLPGFGPLGVRDIPVARLRVLMVISRPAGAADVDYRMVARPLLDRLASVAAGVDLVVLRPPTLQRLAEVLAAARDGGRPFQIVHFDGHGVRPVPGRSPGLLLFEKSTGGPDRVPTEAVGRILADAGVPVVVLNACHSGAVDGELEATVATRLLRDGVMSVVAMAYAVYAVAAAEFMTAFYARIAAGDLISEAMRAGRERLRDQPTRPTPAGPMPLADWLIPVHYARHDVRFRCAPGYRPAPAVPGDDFVGRDALFQAIESALHRDRAVLLHGIRGIGKSALVRAYARWWVNTGGSTHPDPVVWHARGEWPVIAGRLVIWDGFRTGDGEVRRLARAAREHGGWLIVTGWTFPETLTGTLPGLRVGGLDPAERTELATRLLGGSGWATPQTLALVDELDGHPHSMRVLLPQTAATPAGEVLARLRGGPLPPELAADIATGCTTLSAAGRRLLTVLGLQPRTADVAVLRTFSNLAETPSPYAKVSGWRWAWLMDQAARAGLVSFLSGDLYAVHPALPGHLSAAWPAPDREACRRSMLNSVARYAEWMIGENRSGDAAFVRELLAEQHRDLDEMLVYAAEQGLWLHVLAIGEPLLGFYSASGMVAKVRALAHRVHALIAAEPEPLPGLAPTRRMVAVLVDQHDTDHPATPADITAARERHEATTTGPADPLTTAMAECHLAGLARQQGRLDDAARLGTRSLDAFEKLGVPDALATAYHTMGMIRVDQGRYDEAEECYRKAIDLGGGAVTWHEAGALAQRQGRYDEAESRYLRALAANTDGGHHSRAVGNCLQLGHLALQRGRVDVAEQHYQRVLDLAERTSDQPSQARAYQGLGNVALLHDRLDEAEQWTGRAMTIFQEFGDRYAIAMTHGALGTIAEERGEIGEALRHMIRAVSLFGPFPDPASGILPAGLLRYAVLAGRGDLTAGWREVTGADPPAEIWDLLTQAQNHERGTA